MGFDPLAANNIVRLKEQFMVVVFSLALPSAMLSQGTFQNLDFESGSFIPIPGDPYNRVQFSTAMPGWTGYVGTNQISWILYNSLFLDSAGIAIWGPDKPSADFLHGHFFSVLQAGNDISGAGQGLVGSAIAQIGTIPSSANSIRFLSTNPFSLGLSLLFGGNPIPLFNVGTAVNGRPVWGGDVSAFAGQTGELRFQGTGYLDYIQFSNQPIPEPNSLGLFSLALLLGYRSRLVTKSWRSKHYFLP